MSYFNDFTILYLISHVLCDYQLQNDKLSRDKIKDKKILAFHISTHGIFLLVITIFSYFKGVFKMVLLSSLLILFIHSFLDLNKKYIKALGIKEKYIYIIDQIFHILSILFISESLITNPPNIFSREILEWILLILVITKPANVTFKILFSKYQFVNKKNDITVEGAGALIGNLERILSVIFLQLGEVGAIAFIYTAKSIARFKQIEENKRFAEYYLIGTLYSILYAIVAYYLIIIFLKKNPYSNKTIGIIFLLVTHLLSYFSCKVFFSLFKTFTNFISNKSNNF